MKNFIRKITPNFLLNLNRKRKKNIVNKNLNQQKESGEIITSEFLIQNFKEIGIKEGDTLLVHSSLSKIGYLENGPKTIVDALITVVGEKGNILMPTSPNNLYQLEYIKNTPFFDVNHSPSKLGLISEYFRKLNGVKRSIHPTEPVSAYGPDADHYVSEHFNQLTPYNEKSPFYKISKNGGKILYIGVTLSMAGTNLHTLEDAVDDFKFPVYYPDIFDFEVIDEDGVKHTIKTKVHNPVYSKKRKCDDLIPLFEKKLALKKVKVGNADTLLVDAKSFFDVMLNEYHKNGVTMYTPQGS